MLLKYISSIFFGIVLLLVVAIFVGTVMQCNHPETFEVFSFQPQNSTAASSIKTYCDSCRKVLSVTTFRGEPEDSSYLDLVNNGEQLVDGQYYTITAEVSFGTHLSSKNRITCSIKSEDIEVYFSVTFKEEYKEKIDLLKDDDTITFYGKYSSDSFHWMDCELIT